MAHRGQPTKRRRKQTIIIGKRRSTTFETISSGGASVTFKSGRAAIEGGVSQRQVAVATIKAAEKSGATGKLDITNLQTTKQRKQQRARERREQREAVKQSRDVREQLLSAGPAQPTSGFRPSGPTGRGEPSSAGDFLKRLRKSPTVNEFESERLRIAGETAETNPLTSSRTIFFSEPPSTADIIRQGDLHAAELRAERQAEREARGPPSRLQRAETAVGSRLENIGLTQTKFLEQERIKAEKRQRQAQKGINEGGNILQNIANQFRFREAQASRFTLSAEIGARKQLREKPIQTAGEFALGLALGGVARGAGATTKVIASKAPKVAKGLRLTGRGGGAIATGVFIGAETAQILGAPSRSEALGRSGIRFTALAGGARAGAGIAGKVGSSAKVRKTAKAAAKAADKALKEGSKLVDEAFPPPDAPKIVRTATKPIKISPPNVLKAIQPPKLDTTRPVANFLKSTGKFRQPFTSQRPQLSGFKQTIRTATPPIKIKPPKVRRSLSRVREDLARRGFASARLKLPNEVLKGDITRGRPARLMDVRFRINRPRARPKSPKSKAPKQPKQPPVDENEFGSGRQVLLLQKEPTSLTKGVSARNKALNRLLARTRKTILDARDARTTDALLRNVQKQAERNLLKVQQPKSKTRRTSRRDTRSGQRQGDRQGQRPQQSTKSAVDNIQKEFEKLRRASVRFPSLRGRSRTRSFFGPVSRLGVGQFPKVDTSVIGRQRLSLDQPPSKKPPKQPPTPRPPKPPRPPDSPRPPRFPPIIRTPSQPPPSSPPDVPFPIVIPPPVKVPKLKFPDFGGESQDPFRRRKLPSRGRRRTGFTPSVEAIVRDVRGSFKGIPSLSIRPIPTRRRRR